MGGEVKKMKIKTETEHNAGVSPPSCKSASPILVSTPSAWFNLTYQFLLARYSSRTLRPPLAILAPSGRRDMTHRGSLSKPPIDARAKESVLWAK